MTPANLAAEMAAAERALIAGAGVRGTGAGNPEVYIRIMKAPMPKNADATQGIAVGKAASHPYAWLVCQECECGMPGERSTPCWYCNTPITQRMRLDGTVEEIPVEE